jgi:2-polyprenyl-3-methyl-5-hydroxy-6-metoxy-1,4-benzoquinol methylase
MKNYCDNIHCPVCNSSNIRRYFKDEQYLRKCGNCSLVFTYPTPESLFESYDENYYKLWLGKQFRQRRKLWKKRLRAVKRFCKSGKLLDIGTGDGLFLKTAKVGNFEVYGTEISPDAVKIAKKVYDLNIFSGEIEDSGFKENFFDVITIWHVIEHVKNPYGMLKKAYNLLKPGGIIFVATPNLDKYVSRAIYRLKNNRPFPFYSKRGEQHIFHFTAQTLGNLMETAGFRIILGTTDFAAVRMRYKILGWISFFFSAVFRRNWNENILLIGQK